MTLQIVPGSPWFIFIEGGSFTWRRGFPNQPCSFTKEYCRTPLAPHFAFYKNSPHCVFPLQPQETPRINRSHRHQAAPLGGHLKPRHPSCITTAIDANFQIFRRPLIGILQLRSKDLSCDLVPLSLAPAGDDLNSIGDLPSKLIY